MMKTILFLLLLAVCTVGYSQEPATPTGETSTKELQDGFIEGKVLSSSTDIALQNVNILNLSNFKGATTDKLGNFDIKAAVNDTLYFSYFFL